MKKTTWVFLCIKYSKFWSVSLEHFIERKPLIFLVSSSVFPPFSSFYYLEVDVAQNVEKCQKCSNCTRYLADKGKKSIRNWGKAPAFCLGTYYIKSGSQKPFFSFRDLKICLGIARHISKLFCRWRFSVRSFAVDYWSTLHL